ncbi:hypothetical protein BTN49_1624 [Candidatus Enterovibrio escicola]|uniref:Uncharacterized protein n=1 Tax=Candidatus Enterovibrio escicola TaxID=1927127 RepID=A0A2A5T3E5_9GAMM|nr:hypothetical protein BTN49_1624 [Candidatus Enterovibrio escacola]
MDACDSFNQITQTRGCAHSTHSREIERHALNNLHGIYCQRIASKQAK